MQESELKKRVKKGYGNIAKGQSTHFTSNTCCGGLDPRELSSSLGYTDTDLDSVPEGANLGLGCGNPVAIASLQPGEVVLDLGSGAGFDCFLAARAVGERGHVIGVDMTPEMIAKATNNARKSGMKNIEFRLGEIESLPVEDGSVDVIISNCVINLSPEKHKVFAEAFRVLRSGGRMMVSDIVVVGSLPDVLRSSITGHIACVSGADPINEYLRRLESSGFSGISIDKETEFPIECLTDDVTLASILEETGLDQEELGYVLRSVKSIQVRAMKDR